MAPGSNGEKASTTTTTRKTLRIGARKEKTCFNYSHAAYTTARGTVHVPHFDFVYLYGYLDEYYNLQVLHRNFTENFNLKDFSFPDFLKDF